MKKIILFMLLVGLLPMMSCNNPANKVENNKSTVQSKTSVANAKATSEKAPVLNFDETVHDFGKMAQGEIVKNSFHFKNTGNADLLISHISTSCGCTVGKYPHQAVKPGEEGNIEVTFNSAYKMGYQNKSIMILSNTQPKRIVLRIKAMVTLPK